MASNLLWGQLEPKGKVAKPTVEAHVYSVAKHPPSVQHMGGCQN